MDRRRGRSSRRMHLDFECFICYVALRWDTSLSYTRKREQRRVFCFSSFLLFIHTCLHTPLYSGYIPLSSRLPTIQSSITITESQTRVQRGGREKKKKKPQRNPLTTCTIGKDLCAECAIQRVFVECSRDGKDVFTSRRRPSRGHRRLRQGGRRVRWPWRRR